MHLRYSPRCRRPVSFTHGSTEQRRVPWPFGPSIALAVLSLLVVAPACSGTDTVIYRAAHDLVAVPDLFDFGVIGVGSSIETPIRMQNLGAGSATVGTVSLAGAGAPHFLLPAAWSGDIGGGASEELTVVFEPQAAGTFQETLLISLNEQDDTTTIEVALRGQGVDSALISYPLLLDFGPVPNGSNEDRIVVLENVTQVAVQIYGLALSGDADGFEVATPTPFVAFPWTVDALSTLELEVSFDSHGDTAQEGELYFLSAEGLDLGISVDLRVNQCEGSADPGWDADGDGFTPCGGDCDDNDATSNPGGIEVGDGVDNDCDEVIDEDTELSDDDEDGFTELEGDCDDIHADSNPDAEEIADGRDNDCDGLVDEGTSADDADGDGYTVPGGDCDDADSGLHPGAPEDGYSAIANDGDGLDNDCDGIIDEGTVVYDDDGDGYCESPSGCVGSALPGDCNDALLDVNPGASETSNGMDDDCDGIVDDGTEVVDDDADGYTEAGGDCDDANPFIYPAAPELPDTIDNDCDQQIDEGTGTWDDDGDCHCEAGLCGGSVTSTCVAPQPGDCNDDDINIHPQAIENNPSGSGDGDGIDNNCNGTVDEGTNWYDDDGDGFSEQGGDCNDDPLNDGADYSPAVWDNPSDTVDWDCDPNTP